MFARRTLLVTIGTYKKKVLLINCVGNSKQLEVLEK